MMSWGKKFVAMGKSAVALFLPRVADIVVAAHFPEAGAVLLEEGHALRELRALPRIEFRDDDARGPAVLAADGRSAELRRDQHVVIEAEMERHVRRVAVVAGEINELRLRLR